MPQISYEEKMEWKNNAFHIQWCSLNKWKIQCLIEWLNKSNNRPLKNFIISCVRILINRLLVKSQKNCNALSPTPFHPFSLPSCPINVAVFMPSRTSPLLKYAIQSTEIFISIGSLLHIALQSISPPTQKCVIFVKLACVVACKIHLILKCAFVVFIDFPGKLAGISCLKAWSVAGKTQQNVALHFQSYWLKRTGKFLWTDVI